MSLRPGFAAVVTRLWVRLYTSGLAADVRDARRVEIDADLWEHQQDAQHGMAPVRLQIEILMRALTGVRDDLSWRCEIMRAQRIAALERREAMSLSENQIRWLGIAGMAGGILWAGRYLVPLDPGPIVRAYGHVALSILLLLGLAGIYAQQRAQAGRVARVGFALLFTSAGAWSALNVLATVFGVDDQRLIMNVLAIAFVLPIAPGFLLLTAGLRGSARAVPLVITAAFAAWYLLPQTPLIDYFPTGVAWKRGDSPLGMMAFFVTGAGLAVLGYSVATSKR